MKKTIMLLSLVFVITLTSCGAMQNAEANTPETSNSEESVQNNETNKADESTRADETNKNDQASQSGKIDVRLTSAPESSVFNNSHIYNIYEYSTEKLQTPEESTIMLGKKEVNADLIEKKSYTYQGDENIYLSKDENIEYRKNMENDSFGIYAENDFVLSSYANAELTEEKLLEHIRSYISDYLDINILDDYVYSCSTHYAVSTSDATWGATKSEFYLPVSDTAKTETVIYYLIQYQKYCEDIPTSDSISILCDENGNIESFAYNDCNVTWTSLGFDPEKISEAVEEFLSGNIQTEYDMVSYEIVSQRLVYIDNKIQLSVTAEAELGTEEGSFFVLCPLILSIS